MKYPYDLKRKLDHAITDGGQASRIELGIARMAQRENGKTGRAGKWYAGRRVSAAAVAGERARYELAGEALEADAIRRKPVSTLGEAQEFETFRDAMSACALQGKGWVPMHEREAIKVMPGATAVLTIGTEGIDR